VGCYAPGGWLSSVETELIQASCRFHPGSRPTRHEGPTAHSSEQASQDSAEQRERTLAARRRMASTKRWYVFQSSSTCIRGRGEGTDCTGTKGGMSSCRPPASEAEERRAPIAQAQVKRWYVFQSSATCFEAHGCELHW